MTTPEENEQLKLETFLKNQPSFVARLLGSMKKGVKEKFSQKKRDSSRINAAKATEARKLKASLPENSKNPDPSLPKSP